MKQTLLQLSVILILSAVLENILPPSAGKRAFHLLCSVVIFASLASAAGQINLSSFSLGHLLPPAQENEQQMESRRADAVLLAAETGYASAAAKVLQEASVAFSSVHAQCETQNETVVLKKLTVSGVAQESQTAAQNALAAVCSGAKIEFITEGPP